MILNMNTWTKPLGDHASDTVGVAYSLLVLVHPLKNPINQFTLAAYSTLGSTSKQLLGAKILTEDPREGFSSQFKALN